MSQKRKSSTPVTHPSQYSRTDDSIIQQTSELVSVDDVRTYVPLPPSIAAFHPTTQANIAANPDASSASIIRSHISSLLPSNASGQSQFDKKLTSKLMMLENPHTNKTVQQEEKREKQNLLHHRKKLSAREKRQLCLHLIPKQGVTYPMFEPLNILWMQYFKDVMGDARLGESLDQRILKADYHGCILTVEASTCPSYIGASGILIQETTETMRIITTTHRILTIPKRHSIFTFRYVMDPTTPTRYAMIRLFGNQMSYRASERTVKKFKSKPTIAL